MKAGTSYVDYHIQFHQRIAKLLRKHQLVTGMSEEAMVENDLTGPFMPHGIGHPLGLQVHDVAGFMQGRYRYASGGAVEVSLPALHPYSRTAYGVDYRTGASTLLSRCWRHGVKGSSASTSTGRKIEAMKPFGGIRIEDNVVVHENSIEKYDARPETGVMESWLVPAAPVSVVEEIKKSRFITLLAHTDGVAAAKAFVESVRG